MNPTDQSMKKEHSKPQLFSIILVFTAFILASCADADRRPNIILCMGDDHGWDETGYNGHPHLQTPVLNDMAATGLRLDRFYAAHPTCSPTRGSVMTGRHPNRYGTFSPNYSIRPEEISIADILGRAGYACGHFGKWHLGPVKAESPTSPGAMGFDEWLSHDNFFELNPYLSHNGGPPEQYQGESSEILVEQAIRFMTRAREKRQPFFVVVWFGSPHEPYSGLGKDLALYDDLPGRYMNRTVRLTSNETGLQVDRPLGEVLQERYAEITAMDRSLGRLRKWLGQEGLRYNTLLWYCGDNGTSGDGIVTSPFRGQKGTMYEGGIRVPGIIEWPARISSPRTSEVPTVTSDMLPTLCELTGQPIPDRPMDGISLNSLIDGHMNGRPKPICFWQYSNTAGRTQTPYIEPGLQEGTTPLVKQMNGLYTRNFRNFRLEEISERDYVGPRAILGDRYKLVIGPGEDPEIELFDLRADPSEGINLAASKPELTDSMQRQLRSWQQSVLESLTGKDYRQATLRSGE
jgi:arylsulfatase A-like enzyme